jgi:hypothetical protein
MLHVDIDFSGGAEGEAFNLTYQAIPRLPTKPVDHDQDFQVVQVKYT